VRRLLISQSAKDTYIGIDFVTKSKIGEPISDEGFDLRFRPTGTILVCDVIRGGAYGLRLASFPVVMWSTVDDYCDSVYVFATQRLYLGAKHRNRIYILARIVKIERCFNNVSNRVEKMVRSTYKTLGMLDALFSNRTTRPSGML
jgi:hypothetical protein